MFRLSLVLFAVLMCFASCTVVVMSHRDVMSSYRTKEDLYNRFGMPHAKNYEGNLEEWVYYFGTTTTTIATGLYGSNTVVGRSYQSRREAKFIIDQDGKVLRWFSQGINLEVRQRR